VASYHIPVDRPHHDNLFDAGALEIQRRFFARRPALAATPLRSLPALASALGIGALHVKDETSRFGLNAFKAAGALFAVTTLVDSGHIRARDTLVCASEGNHGRAVARAARKAGCAARVYLSESVAPPRAAAIQDEAATIVTVRGTYDDAVRTMARDAAEHGWTVISDTSWDGYEEIPRLIMLGYTRLMDEAADVWAAPPNAIFAPAGVGGLLGAVACWADLRYGTDRPRVVSVEPADATCVLSSVRSGRPTVLAGPFKTVMGGLRCGEMSPVAFPAIRSLVDGYVGIEDAWSFQAIRALANPAGGDPAILAGASGAAALGGLLATLREPELAPLRVHLQLDRGSRVLVLVTEGVTDPDVHRVALSRG